MDNAYSQAGVDVTAGYEAVRRMAKHVRKTQRPEVLSQLGGFGAAFALKDFNYQDPVLVSGTDGVGTKLLLAIQAQVYDQIGIDCVAMCVNDILAQGAEPLFFLDYLAVAKNDPAIIEAIVKGVCTGCQEAGAALIGGETAEMPDMYTGDDFDLAGFAVGLADRKTLIQKSDVQAGDILIGLASSGLHSNGYSLVRKVFFKDHDFALDAPLDLLPQAASLGEELLKPTRIYVASLLPLVRTGKIHGLAHITGGGFVENIPRMLPEGLCAQIDRGTWPVLDIFKALAHYGQISEADLYEIFNMGIGMVAAVAPNERDAVLAALEDAGETAYVIGQVVEDDDRAIQIR
ncbi:phosphoribosylformylglycinamidine cyclo-ligase [Aerococcus sanguinicola]|uniref:Phosphoribosylformylglycinamidine cyclo-ligase n=1 Tax=Aerococcus sanguinicola TaxID=119206 RepID=A0A109RDF2_9LACT|nr:MULTISPECIES: phosphoribosylformylglycinamidine cyclo-ligase [Aerococcus]AMB93966.1 phosphoribosylaminoimidazole synthetase [Aerococcus sanguinicola]MDK7050603.1 phosphoribosylformylglycinamidine cyclo-ligase [Aerococcus sanguinicola]OFT93750.1 phosphoribosylformylglycinamidine cyclo-ligase [Aerococcus sp. HMSC23C02]PKZ20322.1 phosphoribosylformylglycinamidine cyclo-ligase [Aerococcus sanguinicola]